MATETAEKKTYEGNCHCGTVRFVVKHPSLEQHEVLSCNCSICTRNGYLWIYPKDEDFTYTQGEDKLKGYRFGNKKISHNFCENCGTSVTAKHPDHPITAVNVRSFKDMDVDTLKVKYHKGGKDMEPPYEI